MDKNISIIQGLTSADQANPIRITDLGKVQTATAIDFSKVTILSDASINALVEGIKKAIVMVTTIIGGIGPVVLMTAGLIVNGFANITKILNVMRNGFNKLTGSHKSFQHIASAEAEAAVAHADRVRSGCGAERAHLPSPPGGRRGVCLADRAVVTVPDGRNGRGAVTDVGSAGVCGDGGAQARNGAARMVQSLPGARG